MFKEFSLWIEQKTGVATGLGLLMAVLIVAVAVNLIVQFAAVLVVLCTLTR